MNRYAMSQFAEMMLPDYVWYFRGIENTPYTNTNYKLTNYERQNFINL